MSIMGALIAKYATRAMLPSAAKSALRGSISASKRAIPHMVAHKLITTVKGKGMI